MTATILKAAEVRELIENGQTIILRAIEPQPTPERPLVVLPRKKKRKQDAPCTYVHPFMEGNRLRWVREEFVLSDGNCWYAAGIPQYRGDAIVGWLDYPYLLDGEIEPPQKGRVRDAGNMPSHCSRVTVRDVSCLALRVSEVKSTTAVARWLATGGNESDTVWRVELELTEES